jgi:CspA family cold shock protein
MGGCVGMGGEGISPRNWVFGAFKGLFDMAQGTVMWFNDKKGFGFLKSSDNKEYFVHQSDIKMSGFRSLQEGAKVSFTPATSPKGTVARDVVPI